MPDPNAKPWWQSKTIWGLVIVAVSTLAPKYQPIAEALPAVVDQVGTLAGLVLAAYGRVKADKSLTPK